MPTIVRAFCISFPGIARCSLKVVKLVEIGPAFVDAVMNDTSIGVSRRMILAVALNVSLRDTGRPASCG
jgi:hypothetical protein